MDLEGPPSTPAGPSQAPPPIPPRPDLPRPTKRRSATLGVVLLALGGLLVFGALLVAAVALTRDSGTSTVEGAAPTFAPTLAPASGPMQKLTGTFTYPGHCAHEMHLRVQDPSGTTLVETPLSPGAASQGCVETFSADVPQVDSYLLSLVVGVGGSPSATILRGPTYTWDQLKAKDFTLDLTLENFGRSTAKAQTQADLRSAIAAAGRYYARNKTFVGLTPAILHQLEPSLKFDSSSHASKGVVSLRLATPTEVMFAEVTSDGTPIVMGLRPPKLVCYGEIDAKTFQQCIAWEPPGGAGPSSQPSPVAM